MFQLIFTCVQNSHSTWVLDDRTSLLVNSSIQQIYDPSPKSEEVYHWETPRPKAEGFIDGKLSMTEEEGRMLVVFTEVAMVHIWYTYTYYEEVIVGYQNTT